MKWNKQGLIFNPEGLGGWRSHTFMTPAPFLLSKDVIRIYGGFRDDTGTSRIGFIDVSSKDPAHVIKVSADPVLDIGADGMFDDNGVILGSVIRDNDEIRMYYVGFQLVKKVKFLAYSGLAISNDNGENFIRISETPILDRYHDEKFIRAIHTVIKEKDKYRIWYSTGDRWQYINGIPYPQYKIMYTESYDGINIPLKTGVLCVDVTNDEYRIGRPVVVFEDNRYKMYYTRDTLAKVYSAGYAESQDGIVWNRMDEKFQVPLSDSGWDSEMLCYPVPLKTMDASYLFYSGNNMGQSGVGYAKAE